MPPLFQRLMFVTVGAAACGLIYFTVYAAEGDKAKAVKGGDSKIEVPEGTPEELLSFIKKQQASQNSGATRKERMDNLRNACQAIVAAAERIGQAKADDETSMAAIKAEYEALNMLKRLGDTDAGEKLDDLTDRLQKDKRPAIANLLKLQALAKKMERLDATDAKAVESFVADVKHYASAAEPDAQLVPVARAAMVLLYRIGKQDEAAEMGQELVEKFAQSKSDDMLMASVQLASMTGQILEQGHEKQAVKFYREFADRLSKSDNPALRQAAEQMEGSARKLELVGQPMPISGKLVEGGRFDLAQYKGKVVLVDFWATWCGPCIAELPNVKEVYQKYHDRGFEVVGISLDNDVDDLTKFIEKEHLPWPVLFEGGEGTSGWSHPLAKQYGVNAIPMAVLLNREGKVVTLSARGERLGELVDELLGSDAGSDESDAAESKKDKKAG